MPDVGFRKWLDPDYEVMEDDRAVVGLTLREEMRNQRKVAQGGVVAALIDVAMGTAATGGNYDTRKRPMVTLELKVNYIAAARGDRLTADARVIHAGSRTSVVQCDVFDEKGGIVATGLGTFIMRRAHESDPASMPPPPAG